MAPNLFPIVIESEEVSNQIASFVSCLESMVNKRIEVLRPCPETIVKEDPDFDKFDDSFVEYL
jgi:hypothetical protein